MKAARIVVLGVALVAGGIAAYLAAGSKPVAPPPPAPVPQIATVDILIAKSDLNRGDVIAAPDVAWQAWPAAASNPNFIKKSDRPNAMDEFVGAIVRLPLVSGDPIRDPNVVMAKGSGYMAAVLPQGMRAVATEISPEASAGGFILPDDHVDVVLTRHDKALGNGVDKIVSDTILRNVRVLAVDQMLGEKDGVRVVIGKTATLELTQQQAETLEMSRQMGSLSLTLRSLLDTGNGAPEGGDANKEKAGINTVRFGVGNARGGT